MIHRERERERERGGGEVKERRRSSVFDKTNWYVHWFVEFAIGSTK